PCVTFNDHEGSTKSYRYTREHLEDVATIDFIPLRREITAGSEPGAVTAVTMHDGSVVRFRRVAEDYDPTDRDAAYAYVRRLQEKGEVPTGLLFVQPDSADMHAVNRTVDRPPVELPYEELCPGAEALERLMEEDRSAPNPGSSTRARARAPSRPRPAARAGAGELRGKAGGGVAGEILDTHTYRMLFLIEAAVVLVFPAWAVRVWKRSGMRGLSRLTAGALCLLALAALVLASEAAGNR